MQMLIARSEKEIAGLQVLKEEMMKKEREQLQNMKQVGLIEAQQQRETFIKENQAIVEEQKKMMKSILEMDAVNQRENQQLLQQMNKLSPEEFEESMKELVRRQSERVNALLMKMGGIKSSGGVDFNTKTKEDECAKKLDDFPDMMISRAQTTRDLLQRSTENNRDRNYLGKSTILKKVLQVIEHTAPIFGAAASLIPMFSPYAMPGAYAVQKIARAAQSLDCIMQ